MKTLYTLFIIITLLSVYTYADEEIKDEIPYKWNSVQTPWINTKAVMAVILDYSNFKQDQNSINHVGNLDEFSKGEIRGIRMGVVGTFNFERPWYYVAAFALGAWDNGFDVVEREQFVWFDLAVAIPLWGDDAYFSIGKMKEPISQERIMALNVEQTMERPLHLDALLPSRNMGMTIGDTLLNQSMTYKLGIFNDALEQESSFADFSTQYIGRVTGLAYEDKENQSLLHLGLGYRYSDVKIGSIRYRASPEQSFVPDWVDTGKVSAQNSQTTNLELSYILGPMWFATEYTATHLASKEHNDPNFYGYHAAITYALTGEYRGYSKTMGIVNPLTPNSDFTKGGTGAIDISYRYSYLDLTSQDIAGGELGISTFGMSWYPSKEVKVQIQWSHMDLKSNDLATQQVLSSSESDVLQLRWVYFYQ